MAKASTDVSTILFGLRRQYKAAIEMLRRAIQDCPDEFWGLSKEEKPFWHKAYHTLYWLDLYLSYPPRSFKEPPFHTPGAQNLNAELSRPFSREQIEAYLEQVTAKFIKLFDGLAREALDRKPRYGRHKTFFNALLYNLRHVMLHVGQMYSFLKRKTGQPPDWV